MKQEAKALKAKDWLHSKSSSQNVISEERRKEWEGTEEEREDERGEKGRQGGRLEGGKHVPSTRINLITRATLSHLLPTEWWGRGFASQITQSFDEGHPWGNNVTLGEVGIISKEKLAMRPLQSASPVTGNWVLGTWRGEDNSSLFCQILSPPRWQWARWATLLA